MNDTIYRQAAIDGADAIIKRDQSGNNDVVQAMIAWKEWIKGLPSAEPERKTGQWIRHNTYVGDDTSGYVDPDWRCSECGKQAIVNAWCMYDLTDFCPHCGADMRGK